MSVAARVNAMNDTLERNGSDARRGSIPKTLTKRQSSQEATMTLNAILSATESELDAARALLEKKKQSLMAAEVVSESQRFSRLSLPPEDDADEGLASGDQIDELRLTLAASDAEVAERLSNFCPATFRDDYNQSCSRPVALSKRESSAELPPPPTTSTRSSGAASKGAGKRLHALCLEMIETERRYHRDLSLIVHTFVQGLRRVAPELIQPLVSNAEQLLHLHSGLSERMGALVGRHSGVELVDALGSELLSVSPFFVMYVTYCANFMTSTERLGHAHKTNRELAQVVDATEAQITRQNIVEHGHNSHVSRGHGLCTPSAQPRPARALSRLRRALSVPLPAPPEVRSMACGPWRAVCALRQVSIYAFLIKPVQRLCQYPLLFRELVKALPVDPADSSDAPAAPPSAHRERMRPHGGAAVAPPLSGLAKAQYVLAVLEEVAQDVNERVRQQEDSSRVIDMILRGAADQQAAASAVLGPAANLEIEVHVEIACDERGQPVGMIDHAGTFTSFTRKITAGARRKYGQSRPGAPSATCAAGCAAVPPRRLLPPASPSRPSLFGPTLPPA